MSATTTDIKGGGNVGGGDGGEVAGFEASIEETMGQGFPGIFLINGRWLREFLGESGGGGGGGERRG